MSKTMKKFVLAIALFIGLIFTFIGATSIKTINAKATDANTYFSMNSGVQLRLASGLENEPNYGMRFIATMDGTTYENADSFGMVIVPAEYVEGDYATAIANSDGDYLAAYASLGATVLNVNNIQPYSSGSGYAMNGVISDIKYANLNRDFVAIAYYTVDSEYFYTEVSEPVNVYDLAIKALADTKAAFEVEELAVLDEYRFLAEKQTAGVEEETAKDGVLAYTTALANIRAGLTGYQVANFDTDDYVEIVSDALKSKIDIYNGCVTIGNYNKTAYKINLPNPIVVREDTVIRFNLISPANDNLGDGSGGKTYILFNGVDYPIVGHGSRIQEYTTVTKNLVSDFGRTVGEIITSLTFTAWNSGGMGYTNYNYIEVYNKSEKEAAEAEAIKQQLIDGLSGYEVANYNDVNYSSYVSNSSATFSIANGLLTLNTVGENQPFKLKFLEPKTVKANDYITLSVNVPAGKGAYIGDENGNNMYMFVTNSGSLQNDFKSVYYGAGTLRHVCVPVSKLGYSEGDTINGISLTNWNYNTNCYTMVVDYIGYVSPEEDVLVDFTNKSTQGLVATKGASDASSIVGTVWSLGYDAIGYDDTVGAMCINNTTSEKRAFVVNIPAITVTADTEITITLKTNKGLQINPLPIGTADKYAGLGATTDNEWHTVTFKPVAKAGVAAGDVLSQIILTIGAKGTCYFGKVTVSNAG